MHILGSEPFVHVFINVVARLCKQVHHVDCITYWIPIAIIPM